MGLYCLWVGDVALMHAQLAILIDPCQLEIFKSDQSTPLKISDILRLSTTVLPLTYALFPAWRSHCG